MGSENVNYYYAPLFPLPYLKNFPPTITEEMEEHSRVCNMGVPFLMGFMDPVGLYLIIPGDEIFHDTMVSNVPGRVHTYTHATVRLKKFKHRSLIQ